MLKSSPIPFLLISSHTSGNRACCINHTWASVIKMKIKQVHTRQPHPSVLHYLFILFWCILACSCLGYIPSNFHYGYVGLCFWKWNHGWMKENKTKLNKTPNTIFRTRRPIEKSVLLTCYKLDKIISILFVDWKALCCQISSEEFSCQISSQESYSW